MKKQHVEKVCFAIIGYPVMHSLSPQMQEAGFRAIGLDASYDKIEVKPAELAEAVERLRKDGVRGWNVTVPHKENIGQYLDEIDPAANFAGSINTVVNNNGVLYGTSTDGYGLLQSVVNNCSGSLIEKKVVFIGAGGAAKASATTFAQAGVKDIVVLNRTLSKAQALCRLLKESGAESANAVTTADEDQAALVIGQADIIIQSTSLGLKDSDSLPIKKEWLKSHSLVVDMIYRKTALLQAAESAGCQIVDGRGMLLYQGCRSFELWTGEQAPIKVMREALAAAWQM